MSSTQDAGDQQGRQQVATVVGDGDALATVKGMQTHQPPDPDKRPDPRDKDDVPDTPPTEAPPVPVKDPPAEGTPPGPYVGRRT